MDDPISVLSRSIEQWRTSRILDCHKILHEDIDTFTRSIRSFDTNTYTLHELNTLCVSVDEILIYCREKLNTSFSSKDRTLLKDVIDLESSMMSLLQSSDSLALLLTEDRLLLIIRFMKDVMQHTTTCVDPLIHALTDVLAGNHVCVSVYTACFDLPTSSLAVIEFHSELFWSHPEYSYSFQLNHFIHMIESSMKPVLHPIWGVQLTPFCIMLITSLQKFVAHSRDEQKALLMMLHFYQELLQRVNQLSYSDSFIQTHYSELLKCLVNPFTPIAVSLLMTCNTFMMASQASSITKLAIALFPSFINAGMSVKKHCEIGFWIQGKRGETNVTSASIKLLDCCPHCGKEIHSIQVACCDLSEPHHPISTEIQQQLLLNWLATACINEGSSGPWHCSRAILLGQWLCQDNQHWLLSKRRLPDKDGATQLLLPPSHSVLWLFRSLHLPYLLTHTSTLLRYLLSSLNHCQPRVMSSVLSSLQQVLTFSPSLLTSLSIQKAMVTVLATTQTPSILDRIIELLLIDVKEFMSQYNLIRTVVSLSLHSRSRTIIVRACRFLSMIMKELIQTDPIPVQQIVKIEHMVLKYFCNEADPTLRQLSYETLAISWTIQSIPLHSAIVCPLVDNHSSLLVQDRVLYDVLVDALNQSDCQSVIKGEMDELMENYMDVSEMKLFSFLLDAYRQPLECQTSFIHQLLNDPNNNQSLKIAVQYLHRAMNTDYLAIHQDIISLVSSTSSFEGLEYVANLIILTDDVDTIYRVVTDCINQMESSFSIRPVLLLGFLFKGFSRSMYVSLLSKSSGISYKSVVNQLLKHLDSTEESTQVNIVRSVFLCLLHNPNELSSLLVDSLIHLIHSTNPSVVTSALNTLLHYITELPKLLSSPEEAFPPNSETVAKCEPYDFLPNLVKSVNLSIKDVCTSSSLEVLNVSLAYLNVVIDGGFIYGVDYVEIAVKNLCSHQRITRKLAESLLTKIINHCHSVVIVRLATCVTSCSSVQFILMCYHSINKKEEFLFLSEVVNSTFSVHQTDLGFVSSVAKIVADFHYETKANQMSMLLLVKEKLVTIRNEAEEKQETMLYGQALLLHLLIDHFQTKKPFQLADCLVKQDPTGINDLYFDIITPQTRTKGKSKREKKERKTKKVKQSNIRKTRKVRNNHSEDDEDYIEYCVSNK